MTDKFQQQMRPMREAPQGANVHGHSIMACVELENGSSCWVCAEWDNFRSDAQPAGWRRANANGTLGNYIKPTGWLSEEDYYRIKQQ